MCMCRIYIWSQLHDVFKSNVISCQKYLANKNLATTPRINSMAYQKTKSPLRAIHPYMVSTKYKVAEKDEWRRGEKVVLKNSQNSIKCLLAGHVWIATCWKEEDRTLSSSDFHILFFYLVLIPPTTGAGLHKVWMKSAHSVLQCHSNIEAGVWQELTQGLCSWGQNAGKSPDFL